MVKEKEERVLKIKLIQGNGIFLHPKYQLANFFFFLKNYVLQIFEIIFFKGQKVTQIIIYQILKIAN